VIEQRMLLRELPLLETQLAAITAPTRVMIGSADTFVPPSAGRRLATQIPGAGLIEVARAGHVLNVQHPQLVARAILDAAALEPVNPQSPARPPTP
jgi:3-oxoadipate enol-lactonase/4-carboxymuconolactone decarboxylase